MSPVSVSLTTLANVLICYLLCFLSENTENLLDVFQIGDENLRLESISSETVNHGCQPSDWEHLICLVLALQCGTYFWNASLQPWGVSGWGRSWTPSAECEASAAMDERLEVTILVMVTVSSSGGGDSDTEEPHNSPALINKMRQNGTGFERNKQR